MHPKPAHAPAANAASPAHAISAGSFSAQDAPSVARFWTDSPYAALFVAGAIVLAISARSAKADPACEVKSVEKAATSYEGVATSPTSNQLVVSRPDARGVYQLYSGAAGTGEPADCISCGERPGMPRLDRNKPMIGWHPSGKWLVVGVEEDSHDLSWAPASWQRGLLQSGIWLNIWITDPTGGRWFRITDFRKGTNGPSDGFVGIAFTRDGKRGAWAEVVDGNVFANHFGVWRLFVADFAVDADGAPGFTNKRDITPAGARWVEPGNFHPDGRRLLLSADIGMKDAEGQDQFLLDVDTGMLQNLTRSPDVWDEHGLFSPDGSKILFMSSYPYRHQNGSNKVGSLKTEFMVMSADGTDLQQLTHFNEPGYPESQPKNTVAAVAQFVGDGSESFATVMAPDFSFGKTNWLIIFSGRCGREIR